MLGSFDDRPMRDLLGRSYPPRRLFELTEESRTYIEANADECAAPWEAVSDTVGEQAMELRNLVRGLARAAMQVLHAGSAAQTAEARRILTDARRSLYRLLAEDEDAGSALRTPRTIRNESALATPHKRIGC